MQKIALAVRVSVCARTLEQPKTLTSHPHPSPPPPALFGPDRRFESQQNIRDINEYMNGGDYASTDLNAQLQNKNSNT